jgi:hypothetical protein
MADLMTKVVRNRFSAIEECFPVSLLEEVIHCRACMYASFSVLVVDIRSRLEDMANTEILQLFQHHI